MTTEPKPIDYDLYRAKARRERAKAIAAMPTFLRGLMKRLLRRLAALQVEKRIPDAHRPDWRARPH